MISVETLNFHHLRYFWCVVQEGGILPASRRLRVSHPTVSAQIRELEGHLELSLFQRQGRSLELTDEGRRVYAHADRIFNLGRALVEDVRHASDRPVLRIGVTDDLPKLFVRQLLEPIFGRDLGPRLSIDEERHRTLLGRLAVRELDLVLSDVPTPPSFRIEADDRRLGSTGVSFLAAPRLKASLSGAFPDCLQGAPFLAPLADSHLGQLLTRWLQEEGLRVDLVAEVADSALLKTLGGDGLGVFVVPRVAEAAAREVHRAAVLGRVSSLRIEYFGTTPRRAQPDPDVGGILDAAEALLSDEPGESE